jgi:hypothetical protein
MPPCKKALRTDEQLRPLVKGGHDQHPGQHDRESTEGVDLEMVAEPRLPRRRSGARSIGTTALLFEQLFDRLPHRAALRWSDRRRRLRRSDWLRCREAVYQSRLEPCVSFEVEPLRLSWVRRVDIFRRKIHLVVEHTNPPRPRSCKRIKLGSFPNRRVSRPHVLNDQPARQRPSGRYAWPLMGTTAEGSVAYPLNPYRRTERRYYTSEK